MEFHRKSGTMIFQTRGKQPIPVAQSFKSSLVNVLRMENFLLCELSGKQTIKINHYSVLFFSSMTFMEASETTVNYELCSVN